MSELGPMAKIDIGCECVCSHVFHSCISLCCSCVDCQSLTVPIFKITFFIAFLTLEFCSEAVDGGICILATFSVCIPLASNQYPSCSLRFYGFLSGMAVCA